MSHSLGKLICLAGIDGAGKSSFLQAYRKNGCKKAIPVDFYQELRFANQIDSGGILADDIKNCLWLCEFMHSFGTKVRPKLMSGHSVITDRSPLCAQVYSEQTICSDITSLFYVYEELVKPDLLIYLEVSPVEAVRRIGLRKEKVASYETINGLTRIREGYIKRLKQYSGQFRVVDAMLPQELVAETINGIINSVLQ